MPRPDAPRRTRSQGATRAPEPVGGEPGGRRPRRQNGRGSLQRSLVRGVHKFGLPAASRQASRPTGMSTATIAGFSGRFGRSRNGTKHVRNSSVSRFLRTAHHWALKPSTPQSQTIPRPLRFAREGCLQGAADMPHPLLDAAHSCDQTFMPQGSAAGPLYSNGTKRLDRRPKKYKYFHVR